MSDYPPYGANYPARDQTNPPYLPPTYPNQYLQADDGVTGHMASNYNMAAYGYNRAIPTFSAATVASGVPPLPIYQGWNQDAIPLPPYTLPHNAAQYTGYSSDSQNHSQHYHSASHQSYPQNAPAAKPFEPGDLSEGEFEANTPPIGYGATQFRGNDGTGYMDTAQRAVYSRTQNYSPQQAAYPGMLH